MDRQIPPTQQSERQSLWRKLRANLILWGILTPPESEEVDLAEEKRKVRMQIFSIFRRHPGR